MLDHVKRVNGWMTLACHVYDLIYCKFMMIVICNMQLENMDAQCVMWKKLNKVMVNNDLPHPNFKGFMVDHVQANWNVIRIVYGSSDQTQPMVDKERTCYFHWTQSMDRHTKQYIKPELHE
jgi:hypothetical protein